jgi:dTDP-L-rhamnose 4-epimerase
MRVLVTGGAGFIGSHVVDALAEAGADVVVVDSLDPAAHAGPPSYLRDDVEYRWGDVTDPEVVAEAVPGVEAVSHQAARVGLGVDFDDVVRYVHDNDVGTGVLLRALWRSDFRGRLVVASSMVVYGEGGYRCPHDGPTRPGPRRVEDLEAGRFDPPCPRCGRALEPVAVPEEAPVDPRNVYAATKLHTEHLAGSFCREAGVAGCALRYHNVYGPRMPRDTPYAGVASIFRSALEAGRPPILFEDGAQRRDFVHVTDVARANVAALGSGATGAFNVASGTPHSVGDLARALAAAYGPDAPVPEVSGRYRAGDVRHVFASTERAAAVLGFRAGVAFEDGVRAFARAPIRDPVGGQGAAGGA